MMSSSENDKSSSSISGGGGGSNQNNHLYAVLYYKRKNKVHKSKGVSKMDGFIMIDPPPKSTVTLSEDDECCVSQGAKPKNVVFRGIQRDIASKLPFDVDDIVQIGPYEVEIVSILGQQQLQQKQQHSISKPKATKAVAGLPTHRAVTGTTTSAATTAKTKRNVPVPKFRAPARNNNNLFRPVSSRFQNKSTTSTATIPKRVVNGNATSSYKRQPPAQPKKKRDQSYALSNNDDDDDSENCSDEEEDQDRNIRIPQPQHAASLSKKSLLNYKRPLSSTTTTINKPFKAPKTTTAATTSVFRRVNQGTTTSSSSSSTGLSNLLSSTDQTSFFPGAVGNIDGLVPHSIKNVLKAHQIEGIVFLWNCLTGNTNAGTVSPHSSSSETKYTGAILADEMGLGKTLMTIATICALHRKNRNMRFVVVCPSSLVCNWNDEFDKWLGKASNPKRVVVKKGGEQGLSRLKAFCAVKTPGQAEVLIISYDLFRMNSTLFEQVKKIALLAVDEGHRLKNTAGSLTLTALQNIPCQSRLCITATPIQNNLSDFFNIANFVCPGLLGDLSTFRKEYDRPISAMNNKTCTSSHRKRGKEQSRVLDNITKTFMIRRLARDTLKKMLPPRTEVLVFCRPAKVQCQLYRKMARAGIPTSDALTTLISLRKLCSHPSLVDDDAGSSSATNTSFLDSSGKLKTLNMLLTQIRKDAPRDKVVIVSNFTTALSTIEDAILKPNGYTFVRLDGTTELSNRQQLVDTFNKTSPERSFVFLLSSKAGGCGLNLIGANRLVMFDPDWNPASDIQAMARVYRTGQQKPCQIYRLFTSGTVEEVICQRQIQKGNLATLAVDTGGKNSKKQVLDKFTKEELRDCFTLKDIDCDTKVKLGDRWPSYDGIESIRSNGCDDESLLVIASDKTSPISFVHVVKTVDNEELNDYKSGNDEYSEGSPSDQDNDEESSDEENEL